MTQRKSPLVILAVISLVFGNAIIACAAPESLSRKIVIFRENVGEQTRENIANERGSRVKGLKFINGEIVLLNNEDAKKLENDPRVASVRDDIIVQAVDVRENGKNFDALALIKTTQSTPWGIAAIKAPSAWATTKGAGIKVAVIDTGIDLMHPDLRANIKGGINTISSRQSYTDDNGHGTHVAGIIGAVNNTVGVVGVAPAVSLYSVKALDRKGSGYLSDIVEGMEWAITNKMQVINMSLGTSYNDPAFAAAVTKVHNAGIVIVAVAGNEGGAVLYPAKYPEVIAVSATDVNNANPAWSNFGSEVDLAAPGLSIYSTYKGSAYATMSGTSMASPHVAGAAALVLTRLVGSYDADGDGKWDPDEVLQKLENTATDYGIVGYDQYFGFGLVNAFAAIQ